MSTFSYTLKDERGKNYRGTIEAKDKKEAQAKLDRTGYYLTSLSKQARPFLLSPGAITNADVIVFFHHCKAMINAGIPILKTLTTLADQTDKMGFRKVIDDMRSNIESGATLSGAMARHPKVFSKFIVNMIEAAETSGKFADILGRLAQYLEKEEETRRQLRAAFSYPVIVFAIAIVVVTYLLVAVVPIFETVYANIKVSLPMPTIILLALSKLFTEWWILLFFIVAASWIVVMKISKFDKAKFFIDRLKLSVPLFGGLNRITAVSRFVRSLGYILSSGIPLARALELAEPIASNMLITRAINSIKEAVNRGENISDSLRRSRVFPPIVVQMVATGEESGNLDAMLDKAADFLDDEINMIVATLKIRIEPMLTVMLAVVIGFIALAIYLPIFDLIRQVVR